MPAGSRSLPGRPSLRYLKIEAKRRLAAGEFGSLNDAQAAIAREYGQPSWAALRQLIRDQADQAGTAGQQSHALDQVRWVISRFSGAGEPGWRAPGEEDLRQHFSEPFLTVLPPGALITAIGKVAADLRGELVVIRQSPLQVQVELSGLQYLAGVEAEPPHRLTGLRGLPLGSRIRDPRVATPAPARTQGEVPAEVPEVADQAFAELGLAALLLAGGDPEHPAAWVLAKGWADLTSRLIQVNTIAERLQRSWT